MLDKMIESTKGSQKQKRSFQSVQDSGEFHFLCDMIGILIDNISDIQNVSEVSVQTFEGV